MTASSLNCCAAPSVSPVTPPSLRRNQRPHAQPTPRAASAATPQARFAPYALPGPRACSTASPASTAAAQAKAIAQPAVDTRRASGLALACAGSPA